MNFNLSDRTLKHMLLIGSGLVLGYCVYIGHRVWMKRYLKSIDEGFVDDSKIEEFPKKRVLVLGLENAGKSTILSQISTGHINREPKPTEGFNVVTLTINTKSVNIWEIGGRDNIRPYWSNFLQDTDLLVFVVDASDIHNLSLAVREVKWLLADERLANVPVLVIAHKQDKKNAIPPGQVADALDLGSIHPSKHKIQVLGSQAPPDTDNHPSLSEVEVAIFKMLRD